MATEGGRISPPGRWGGSWPLPMARSIFFFFGSLEKSPEVGGGWRRRRRSRRWEVGGGRWRRPSPKVGYLFGCLIC
jgi:hypothetical protein